MVKKLVKVRDVLADAIPTFEPRDSEEKTLEAIHPRLVEIHDLVCQVTEHDAVTRHPDSLGLSLDDLVCEDRQPNLRKVLLKAMDASDYTLSRGVSSYKLLKRVDEMEELRELRELESRFHDVEDTLTAAVAKKADKKETNALIAKKASNADFLQLKEVLYRRLDEVATQGSGPVDRPFSGGAPPETTAGRAELLSLKERFDLLYRQFQDLALSTQAYVPRSEVEEAMQAVLLEIKRVRSNTLDKKGIDKIIEKKADQAEFEMMINALSGSLDGLREYVEAASMNNRAPTAIRAKCLVCDKPTDPVAALAELEASARQIVTSKGKRDKSQKLLSKSIGDGYNKADDPSANLSKRPNTMSTSLDLRQTTAGLESLSTFNNNNRSAAAEVDTSSSFKVLPEISLNAENLKRNVVDLRPISPGAGSPDPFGNKIAVQFVEVNNRSSNSSTLKSGATPEAMKQRIRASVGGGVARPASTDNTR